MILCPDISHLQVSLEKVDFGFQNLLHTLFSNELNALDVVNTLADLLNILANAQHDSSGDKRA